MTPDDSRGRNRDTGRSWIWWLSILTGLMAVGLVAAACGGEDAGESSLQNLQLVSVDFELNSIVITNNGARDVRTEGLWVYQAGEAFEFNIFTIEPRATIRFSVRDLGGVDPSGGEIALFDSSSFASADSMLDYVAWGGSSHDRIAVATEARLWAVEDTVNTAPDTILLIRSNPSANGSLAWDTTSTVP